MSQSFALALIDELITQAYAMLYAEQYVYSARCRDAFHLFLSPFQHLSLLCTKRKSKMYAGALSICV